jgi:uncharacterized protein (DUF1778 family)
LEARVSPAQKALFKKAAAIQGRTLTEFMINSIAAAAEKTVRDEEVIRLSERDRRKVVKALLHPGKPNKALREAAAWYKRTVEKT